MPLARSICRPKWIACLAWRTEVGAPGQNHLLGPPLADGARQVLRPSGARHDAECHLGQREAGGLGGVDEIAAQRPFAAAGIGGAVDRADDWDRATDKSADHPLKEQVLVLPGLVGHPVAFL